MSTQIKPLIVGLASPGLLWLATSVAFGQNEPAPQGPPTAAPTSPATYQALLLTSGTVVRGTIIDVPAAGAFCLKGSGGPVPYPKTRVLKAAQSVEELYQFQVDRLPIGDADERVKLAKWCLTEKLEDHAREQLEIVEKMSPGDQVVQRMLYSLAASEPKRPLMDPEVRRSSAEIPRGEAPEALSPSVRKHGMQYNGLPVIFDLPPAQAVKRFNEFAEYVQPVLQQNCVKCHNEKYSGNFQLVEARIRRDRTNIEILRANLDATLALVNQDDPSRSELLSAGLVPHGGNRNAIFKGPNDQAYRILVTWIKQVRPAEPGQRGPSDSGGRPGFKSSEPMPGDGFATDRSSRTNASPGFPLAAGGGYPPLPENSAETGRPGSFPIPPGGTVNRYDENAEFVTSPGDRPQFPTPYTVGGAPVNSPNPPRTRTKPGTPESTTPQNLPRPSTQTAKPVGRGVVQVAPVETLNELPGMDKPLYPTPPSKADEPTPDTAPAPSADPKKKPKKLDDALLERIMKSRNGNAAGTGTP